MTDRVKWVRVSVAAQLTVLPMPFRVHNLAVARNAPQSTRQCLPGVFPRRAARFHTTDVVR